MSQYDNNLLEEFNEDGYDNDKNFYYLTDNEANEHYENNNVNELNEDIYQEDNNQENNNQEDNNKEDNIEHMKQYKQHVLSPIQPQDVQKKVKIIKKESKKEIKSSFNWLYIFLIILIIALVVYFLIEKKYIKLPSFGSSTSSVTSSSSLGSTFMSLH